MKLSHMLREELEEAERKLKKLEEEKKRIEQEITVELKHLEILYKVINELKRNEDHQETE